MPERELPDNERFNNHVSIVRIRSEHAIGFLKGRFQSLKGLRIRIVDERSHKFATYWVLACVAIHSFAMQCEEEERRAEGGDSDGVDDDPFIYEGLSSSSEESEDVAERRFDFGAGSCRTGELEHALALRRRCRLCWLGFRCWWLYLGFGLRSTCEADASFTSESRLDRSL